ncbi:BCL2/adenovirus E1B 19 kDa protein-interacting protein 2 isoform X3 [Sinocyclocheilus rhinocerous]|uniref:BCL2/adenovirus E1B 19 kDa protein-interacting protein 2 isoform X3 n=1 Tax=Sinocyclocheilus rhinocerous TaxID=307959 RepID=UPI0007B88814|nr:PREDICTED: BCL2/adenovirus E1B 19 kDa protein-interacting protein 2-like isoform X3 [Sinocyclocheilus rhinocerous]
MATDVIATEEVSNQRDSSDLNASKSNPESDTPNRTSETQENRNISSALSLSSSVHSGEEPPQDSIAGNSPANGGSAIRPGDPPQEAATPDNRQKQGVRTSTPVRAPQTLSSPAEHNGSFEHQESVATTEARLRMEGVELKEEWQDEDFPRPLPEEEDIQLDEELFTGSSGEGAPASQSYGLNSAKKTKKKLLAPDISLNLDHSEGSVLSDELDESTELDLDDIDTPSDNSNEFEWEDDLPKPKNADLLRKGVESVQEFTSTEEREEGRRWRVFHIGEQEHRVDMKAIEPYKRVIGHGGYYGDGLNAIIVFAVCFMPESNQPNYRYIMDNLFKYVIGTLELLVAENYMIVYLNGATSRRKMPSVGWLRKCYQQIDRRLRKNLKSLMIVHPSWFIRTLLALTKPFISSKFSQKIKYVYSLTDLAELVPMEYVSIPDCIKQIDQDMRGKVEIATAAVPE